MLTIFGHAIFYFMSELKNSTPDPHVMNIKIISLLKPKFTWLYLRGLYERSQRSGLTDFIRFTRVKDDQIRLHLQFVVTYIQIIYFFTTILSNLYEIFVFIIVHYVLKSKTECDTVQIFAYNSIL